MVAPAAQKEPTRAQTAPPRVGTTNADGLDGARVPRVRTMTAVAMTADAPTASETSATMSFVRAASTSLCAQLRVGPHVAWRLAGWFLPRRPNAAKLPNAAMPTAPATNAAAGIGARSVGALAAGGAGSGRRRERPARGRT